MEGKKTTPNLLKAAVIGLGSMGMGMAQSIARGGIPVSGFDVNPASLSALSQHGGLPSTSAIGAAAESDILATVVVNAAQTRAVLFGKDGVAPAIKRGGVIISCATMAPGDARELATEAEKLGLLYLDAPMSGGATKAAAGQLTFMASGTPEAFERAKPVLDLIAGKVYNLGDAAGAGASFKMVNQLLAGVHIAAACEAMTFAARLGLDLDKVYEVIAASAGNSWMFENRVPHILDGDYSPRSAVSIFTKDLGIVSDMARQEKFPLQIASTALQMFLMTAAAGMASDDDASVARMIAQITGLQLPAAKAN